MTKRKLILGLLVFIFGIAMTACGDKNNTSNTTNKNTIPKSFEDDVCEDCIKTYTGTLRIDDENLYLQAFGYRSGSDITFGGGTIFEQILGNMAIAIAEPLAGVVVCGTQIFLSELIAKALKIDNFEAECRSENFDLSNGIGNGGFDDDEVKTSYSARIRVRYVSGRAEAVELTVNDNLDDGEDSQEIFYYDRANMFINDENSLTLTNASGRILFNTTGGRVIGEFRK